MDLMRASGNGTKRKDGRWQTCLSVTRSDGTKNKIWFIEETQTAMLEAKAAYLRDHGRSAAPKGDSLEVLRSDYLRERGPQLAEKTLSLEKTTWVRIGKALGAKSPRDIDPPTVWRFLQDLTKEKGISGRYVQIHRNALSSLMRYGVQMGRVKLNPCVGLGCPMSAKAKDKVKITPGLYRYLRIAELEHPRWRVLWRLMGECGLRVSEAAAAELEDVSIEKGIAWLAVRGTKTAAAKRRVPVPLDLLEEWERIGRDPGGTGVRNVHRAWYRLLGRCPRLAGLTTHGLRRRALSGWIAAGVPDDVVKEWAGHARIALTKEVYNEVQIKRQAEAVVKSNMVGQYVKHPVEKREMNLRLGTSTACS